MRLPKKLLTLLVFAVLLALTSLPASAATQKVHIGLMNTYSNAHVELSKASYKIKNLKCKNKNLIVKQTGWNIRRPGSTSADKVENTVDLVLIAKKEGTYTVTYDVYNGSKKVSSNKLLVYANSDSAVKSITYAGKDLWGTAPHLVPASGTLKVILNKGYQLKSIEVGKNVLTKTEYYTDCDMKYKKFKNGSKLSLGKQNYEYLYESGELSEESTYYHKNYHCNMDVDVEIRITYVDKYTKTTETLYEYISKLYL